MREAEMKKRLGALLDVMRDTAVVESYENITDESRKVYYYLDSSCIGSDFDNEKDAEEFKDYLIVQLQQLKEGVM